MNIKQRSLIFSLFFITCITTAQTIWKAHYSANCVSAVLRQGNIMWVGTDGAGLFKIDVTTGDTTVYHKLYTDIQSNRVSALALDKAGNLIVGFWGTGIQRFDGNHTWQLIADLSIRTKGFAVEKDTIWVSSPDGAFKITPQGSSSLSIFSDNMSNCVAVDSAGVKWFGSQNYGIISYKNSIIKQYDKTNTPILNNRVNQIKFDKSGKMWVATGVDGLIKFDGTNWQNWDTGNSTLSSNTINQFEIDTNNDLWLVYKTLVHFDGQTFTEYTIPGSTVNTDMLAVGIDGMNTKWIGTYDMGLFEFKKTGSTTSFTKKKIANTELHGDYACAMAEDKNGKKWFATNSPIGGVSCFDGINWKTYNAYNSGYTSNHCWNLGFDNKGNTWAASWDALFKFDGNVWTAITSPNVIHNLKVDKAGLIWMTSNDEVMTYDGSNWKRYPLPNSGSLFDMAFDRFGNCWIPNGEGLYKFAGSTYTQYTPANSAMPSAGFTCIDIESTVDIDYFWIGSSYGLMYSDGPNWKLYDTKNSPLTNDFVDVVRADRGNVWMVTYSGIAKFNGRDTWSIYDEKYPVVAGTATSISLDNAHHKWVGFMYDGFIEIDDDYATTTDEKNPAPSIYVYPNPSQESVTINFKNNPSKGATFLVMDMAGKIVLSQGNIAESQLTISLSGLAKGTYMYNLSTESQLLGRGKLVIQ